MSEPTVTCRKCGRSRTVTPDGRGFPPDIAKRAGFVVGEYTAGQIAAALVPADGERHGEPVRHAGFSVKAHGPTTLETVPEAVSVDPGAVHLYLGVHPGDSYTACGEFIAQPNLTFTGQPQEVTCYPCANTDVYIAAITQPGRNTP